MSAEPLEPIPDPEEEEGGPIKPFLEHLEDLRWVIIKVVVSILVAMAVCLVAAPTIIEMLKVPLLASGANIDIKSFGPLSGIVVAMKVSFWGGFTLSLPFVLFFVGEFIMPALKKHEKTYFRKAFIIGGGLFFLGVLLCYGFIMQYTIQGMDAFNVWMKLPTDTWRAEEYFQFVVMFMVGMGASFEIPVLILTLVKMGLLSHEMLVKGRIYFFIGNMVLCAFITPDAFSTLFMVIPVQILMEICIQISAHWERKKRIAEAKERGKLP